MKLEASTRYKEESARAMGNLPLGFGLRKLLTAPGGGVDGARFKVPQSKNAIPEPFQGLVSFSHGFSEAKYSKHFFKCYAVKTGHSDSYTITFMSLCLACNDLNVMKKQLFVDIDGGGIHYCF